MFSLPCLESTATEAVGDTLREFDDLQREVVSEESNQENAEDQEAVFCVYYWNVPCILEQETLREPLDNHVSKTIPKEKGITEPFIPC